jgi:hypothetical protein
MTTPVKSSTVARLKSQLDSKTKTQELKGTPAHHEVRVRTQADKERKQAEVAKKMAARFNLTYRALELSAARRAAQERERDLAAKKSAQEAASKYQMTARALKMSATGTAKGRVRVGPPAKGEMQGAEEAAGIVDDFGKLAAASKPSGGAGSKPAAAPASAAAPAAAAAPAHEPMQRTPSEEEEEDDLVILDDSASVMRRSLESTGGLSRITEMSREHMHEEHDAFWLPELARAVETNDQGQINAAVVRSFFEEHDPERIPEAAELLAAHEGREDQLMQALMEQYPPPDAEMRVIEPALTMNVVVDASGATTITAGAGQGGFILSGVRPKGSSTFVVNSIAPEESKILRQRMIAKGIKAEAIDVVVGEVSEML